MTKKKYQEKDIVGPYTLIEYLKDGRAKLKCNKCGVIIETNLADAERSRMCRFCRTNNNIKPRVDLTGQRFGRLIVLGWEIVDGHGRWKCKCDCGNITFVRTGHLNNEHTKSCGCYMRDRTSEANSIDLSGKVFGKLLALHRTSGHLTPAGQNLSEYMCRCSCGNEIAVLSMNLVSGNTQSCGCDGCSRGENLVREILNKNNITYKPQYTFKELLSEKGAPLRFDFGVINQDDKLICLIEFNGEQHYYEEESNKQFGKQQRDVTDNLKRKFCDDNNIPLFIIRYDEDISRRTEEIVEFIKEKLRG